MMTRTGWVPREGISTEWWRVRPLGADDLKQSSHVAAYRLLAYVALPGNHNLVRYHMFIWMSNAKPEASFGLLRCCGQKADRQVVALSLRPGIIIQTCSSDTAGQ